MNRTQFVKKQETLNKRYYILDATGKTLGRFASEISKILRGKHKPDYTPNADTGDGVIVINAEKIRVSGEKEARKVYRHYTGWVGGLRETTYRDMQARKPEEIIMHAVKGMMPKKSKLSRQQIKKLRVFKGPEHNMQAQQPVPVNI